LWTQLEADLVAAKKDNKGLTVINHLIILRNFATLRMKGFGWMAASQHIAVQWHKGSGLHFAQQIWVLARHYQQLERLPDETCGGNRGHSLLADTHIQMAARQWLMKVKTGAVTPCSFCDALNNRVLPTLGITLKRPLCECTARRWLVKLGWRRTLLRKGVYKDGHNRPDVVKYRQETFLPAMAKYERQMVQFEGHDLKQVEPNLEPGERRIIAVMQDESSFYTNEYKASAWSVLLTK
jgi:hypothetical protein